MLCCAALCAVLRPLRSKCRAIQAYTILQHTVLYTVLLTRATLAFTTLCHALLARMLIAYRCQHTLVVHDLLTFI